MIGEIIFLLLILGAVLVVVLMTTIVQVEQYESGVALRLGKFHTMLNPGWNFVIPLITKVFKVDLRIQVLDVPRQEVITKDNSPTMVDAVVYYRVADAKKAVLNVANYRAAIVNMAQTTLRGVVGDMELDEIFSSRDKINAILRDKLDIETFDQILIANARGPYSIIRSLMPLLHKSSEAVVINVSSISAFTGSGSNIAYCASKAALDTMTMSLARVFGPKIRFLCVSPAAVATDFVQGRDRGALEKLAEKTPLNKVVEPDDDY